MASPVLQTCDMVGNLVTLSDLGQSAGTILATASPVSLTAMQTPGPETMLLLVRLSSGTLTVNVDVAASGTYASADHTLSGVNDTAFHALVFDTSNSTSYVNVRLETSANAIIDRFGVLSLGRLSAGEEFRSVRAGRNAFLSPSMASGSDGSGSWLADINVSA